MTNIDSDILDKMDVSVIIVNYNSSGLLKNCVSSVIEKTKNIQYEIIVVDNHSADNSVPVLRSCFPSVLLVEPETNLGFGRACNAGAARASGKYLFFLNNDTLLENNAIYILFDFLEGHPDCAVCGGNLKSFDNKPLHSYNRNFSSPFLDIYMLFHGLQRIVEGKNFEYNYTGKPMKAASITGADMMIRSDVFRGENGFDPFFFMYYEETELTYRIHKNGGTVYSVPEAKIFHKKGASVIKLPGNSFFYDSKYYYIKKTYGKYNMVLSFCFFCFILYIKCLYYLVAGKPALFAVSRANMRKSRASIKKLFRG